MLLPLIWNEKGNCFKLLKRVISQVEFEIGQIEQLLESYAGLLERTKTSRPDLVEITALASILHSFYNGIENIFLSISKGIDAEIPTGTQWHRDLLTQMPQANQHRAAVLTIETTRRLADYLGFRHFFRHSYSFFLDWNELEKLIFPLTEVWAQVKAELQQFLAGLNLDGN